MLATRRIIVCVKVECVEAESIDGSVWPKIVGVTACHVTPFRWLAGWNRPYGWASPNCVSVV